MKASGRCLVSRGMQDGLPCDKYHAPQLQMLAKMQSLSLKHWQNAIPHTIKMLCFWFSFTKAAECFWVLFAFSQSVEKMCKDLLSGARWQRWLLLRDWTGLGSTCPVQGSKGNHMSYIKNFGWSTTTARTDQPSSCSVCLYKRAVLLWTQRGGKRERVTQRDISDVKCLFQGHLWGRDLCAHYLLVQAYIQNCSSAPNTYGIVLKTTGASLKLCGVGKESTAISIQQNSWTKITFANWKM